MSKSARAHPSPEKLIAALPRDYQPMARAALAKGWRITRSGNGHTKLTPPTGRPFTLPGSGRVAINLYKEITGQLRKAGLDW